MAKRLCDFTHRRNDVVLLRWHRIDHAQPRKPAELADRDSRDGDGGACDGPQEVGTIYALFAGTCSHREAARPSRGTMRKPSLLIVISLSLIALSAVACQKLDPRQQAAAAVAEPGAAAEPTTTAAPQTPDADSDAGRTDVWPPGPGPEPETLTAASNPAPAPDADSDATEEDVWPPGPGPGPEGLTAASDPAPAPDADSDATEEDVWPPGPGPGPEGAAQPTTTP